MTSYENLELRTENDVRDAFWRDHYEHECDRNDGKRQGDYSATIRAAFTCWLDSSVKSGQLSDRLASDVTL